MKPRFILSFAFLLAALATYGQKDLEKGYIVTYKNDTIFGQIDVQSNAQNSKSCLFLDPGNQTLQSFSPDEIKCFRTSTKYYIVKEVTIDSVKQKLFLEYLVDGIADLYYLRDPLNEYYYIEKNGVLSELSNKEITIHVEGDGLEHNDRTFVKNSNQYVGVLNYLFQDGKEMAPKIARTDFQYRSLINLTKDYHEAVCKDGKCIDYTRSADQKVYLEIGVGGANTTMTIKTSKDQQTSFSPVFGVQFRFMPQKSNTKWNLLIGMNYSENSFHGYFSNSLYEYQHRDTFDINITYGILRIPLDVQYVFGQGKFRPLIFLGYNGCLLMSSSYTVFGHLNEHNYDEYTPLRKFHHGFEGGAGFNYHPNSKNYWFLKARYEYRIPSANGHYVLDYMRNATWMINFGYAFSL